MHKCKPLALGIACGVLWSLSVFFIGIVSMFGWGTAFIPLLGSFYLGYSASFGGAVIGAIWALADGFIGGAVLAWLYNVFASSR